LALYEKFTMKNDENGKYWSVKCTNLNIILLIIIFPVNIVLSTTKYNKFRLWSIILCGL